MDEEEYEVRWEATVTGVTMLHAFSHEDAAEETYTRIHDQLNDGGDVVSVIAAYIAPAIRELLLVGSTDPRRL